MKLIIFGAPGSGKGTQAKLLSKQFKLKNINSNLLREEISKNTQLGKIFSKYMNQGKLVPSKLIDNFFKKKIPKNNFILDGYPRKIEEAEYFSTYNSPDKIIFLDVPNTILKKRLLKRAKIEHRIDDTPKIIEERFKVYRNETKPVLKYYKGQIITIKGNKKPDIIHKEILKALKND